MKIASAKVDSLGMNKCPPRFALPSAEFSLNQKVKSHLMALEEELGDERCRRFEND
jgi:hypothetical protein